MIADAAKELSEQIGITEDQAMAALALYQIADQVVHQGEREPEPDWEIDPEITPKTQEEILKEELLADLAILYSIKVKKDIEKLRATTLKEHDIEDESELSIESLQKLYWTASDLRDTAYWEETMPYLQYAEPFLWITVLGGGAPILAAKISLAIKLGLPLRAAFPKIWRYGGSSTYRMATAVVEQKGGDPATAEGLRAYWRGKVPIKGVPKLVEITEGPFAGQSRALTAKELAAYNKEIKPGTGPEYPNNTISRSELEGIIGKSQELSDIETEALIRQGEGLDPAAEPAEELTEKEHFKNWFRRPPGGEPIFASPEETEAFLTEIESGAGAALSEARARIEAITSRPVGIQGILDPFYSQRLTQQLQAQVLQTPSVTPAPTPEITPSPSTPAPVAPTAIPTPTPIQIARPTPTISAFPEPMAGPSILEDPLGTIQYQIETSPWAQLPGQIASELEGIGEALSGPAARQFAQMSPAFFGAGLFPSLGPTVATAPAISTTGAAVAAPSIWELLFGTGPTAGFA